MPISMAGMNKFGLKVCMFMSSIFAGWLDQHNALRRSDPYVTCMDQKLVEERKEIRGLGVCCLSIGCFISQLHAKEFLVDGSV